MIRKRVTKLTLMLAVVALAGCDSSSQKWPKNVRATYSDCLKTVATGSSQLSISDMRDICAEAAQVVEPFYKMGDGKLEPGNEFTKCYVTEKSELAALGDARAERLARLSCKYPEMK